MSGNRQIGEQYRLMKRSGLDDLIKVLRVLDYRVIGPTESNGVIEFAELGDASELPWGLRDEQKPGSYSVSKGGDRAFEFSNGPTSLKRYFHPTERHLWTVDASGGQLQFEEARVQVPKYAFLGIRPCDLASLDILDQVFLNGVETNRYYESCRQNSLYVAVNCSSAGDLCFCASMETGPTARSGFDISLTELRSSDAYRVLIEIETDRGRSIVNQIDTSEAHENDLSLAREQSDGVARSMGRTLHTWGLRERLQENADDPAWADVAERCLTCGNCTMVCPTCFCTTVEDRASSHDQKYERWNTWDSCFSLDFTFVSGGALRQSSKSRYRQWLTHKLSTWVDQFGVSGCVGCGRCIAWCPVGIDITEEAARIGEPQARA